MVRSFFRALGPTESQHQRAARWVAALALAPTLAACASYEPVPVDVARILADLEAHPWTLPEAPDRTDSEGASPGQLASFAVTHNPSLQAVRAQVGIAQALLVEAGLLSDPEIGWDGMDAFASQIVDGTTSPVDFISGFGLTLPLPRPGELGAKKGAARWRIEELSVAARDGPTLADPPDPLRRLLMAFQFRDAEGAV